MSTPTQAEIQVPAPSEFDVVVLPADDEPQRRVSVVLVGSVALSFISFWRAAAIVLNDMASTVYYIGGISEQAIGKAAPWFVLAVMLFAYAVRAVYVESCTMFTRGGVYRVVKEAMGGPLAKLSVSALMFDYVLTGPISAVSAGQYLVGMVGNLLALTPLHLQLNADVHPQLVKLLSMLIAIGITVYFWRLNLIGIRESSTKALRIMQLTTVMGVVVIGWALVTVALRPETRHMPPVMPVLTVESQGWLAGLPKIVGTIGILIAFGHTLLAMSGEESLAQVYREIEAPKVRNLLKAGALIALYSLVLTGVVTFLAVMIIPDAERIKTTIDPATGAIVRESAKYTDNLISGLVMHLAGPSPLRLALQAFVVFVGFLILSGAVNTSIVGSNGVLNRLAEDGILTPWFLHPQPRFGTTHRLINIVCVLQLLTIVASMGNVYTLGEAYAFGVIWSFVFKTLAMVVLRFKDKSPREYEVPLNLRVQTHPRGGSATTQRIDLPIGIGVVFLVLASTAVVNLFTKKVATVWGVSFTAGFLLVILVCEQISRRLRGGGHHEHLEQFNERVVDQPTPAALALAHPDPIVVAIRNPRSMGVLDAVLRETDTTQRDVVAVTCKVLPPLTPGITPEELTIDRNDREVLTRVVNLAEEAGKQVHPLVIPTNNPLYAIATVARDLGATEVVLGTSAKSSTDRLLEQFAIAWGMAGGANGDGRPLAIRVVGNDEDVRYEL
jgi:amino acid transporter/nucleotide-binding universal stress UspA family protein